MENQTTTFSDIFKNSFLEGFDLARQNLTVANVILALLMALGVGLFIYFVYRKTYRGVLYSHTYNLSLILITMITTLVIMVISHSLGLSLGMVGALSIVRFRTALKDPSDSVYMFWSIVEGITLGAGFYLLAIVGALCIGAAVFGISFLGKAGGDTFLLVIHCDQQGERAVAQVLKRIQKKRLKSKTVTRGGTELTYEIRLPNSRTGFVDELLGQDGVIDAALVSYKGDLA
ncbi:MAG: DUF4956 domain-containing protein [Clostridia bacterium]|nr:DUF4956 domain-containing protein [Clostridia bacterium]